MPNYPLIRSRVIKYDSPSGKVRIGKYIPPFEKFQGGFGFKGVILEDSKSGKLQCHYCGEWFEQMPIHLSHKHEMTCSEYKTNVGLLQSTALKTKRMRLIQSKVMQKLRKKNPQNRLKFEKNNIFAGNRKDKPKANEHKNKFGVCELQVMERITEMTKELGKTPTLTQLSERYGGGFMTLIHSRYGSYVKYCQDIGLIPNFSNFYPKYNKEYFIEKAMSNEPSMRIFTVNERAGLYRYFKSIKQLKSIVKEMRSK